MRAVDVWRSLEQLSCVQDVFSINLPSTKEAIFCDHFNKFQLRKSSTTTADYVIWEHADEAAAVYFDIARIHCSDSSGKWFQAGEHSLRLSGVKWAYSDGIPFAFHFGSLLSLQDDINHLHDRLVHTLKAPRAVLDTIASKLRYLANCASISKSRTAVPGINPIDSHRKQHDNNQFEDVENFYTSTASKIYLSVMVDEND
jgi:hypothetical protein